MNVIHILGNTGIKPEVRFTATGKKYTRFTLATNRSWGKGEDKVTYTDWFNVECWIPSIVDVLEKWGFEGQRLQVTGRVQTDQYEDNGVTKWYTKVVADQVEIETWQEQEECEHEYEPTDTSGHYYECTKCGKAATLAPVPQ